MSIKKRLLNILLGGLLFGPPVFATDYPPALNFNDFGQAVRLGTSDFKLYFAQQYLSVRVYVPGRDVQVRTDIVNASGQILSSKERMHKYINGQMTGEIDGSVHSCLERQCLNGPNSVELTPGLYWMVFSEKGKAFSAEWFEVRSYSLGEGRFAKGEIRYAYLPQTQMAQIYFDSNNQLFIEAGFAGEKEVGDQSSIQKKVSVSLKHNNKLFAKSPGSYPQQLTLYPYTSIENLGISKLDNSIVKKSDLKDGKYDLEIQLDGKLARKFSFEVTKGKIKYQGRQKEDTIPSERMIVSEKSYWLWNTLVKEPSHQLPSLDLTSLPNY